MKKRQIIIAAVILFVIAILGVYAFSNNRNKPTSYNNSELINTYPILASENLWRGKLIGTDNPEKWSIPAKNTTIQAVDYSGNFMCGSTKADFSKFSSFNTGATGGWNNISIVDCGDYYFVFEYGDAGPKLFGPFDRQNNPVANSLQVLFPNGGEILEIGKSYDLKWQNNSGQAIKTIAIQAFGVDKKDYGYHNIITANIPSTNAASTQWKVPTSIDPQYDYKLVAFDSNRKVIGQSANTFKIAGLNVENPIESSTTFEIGKPFTASGKPLPGSSFAPLYTSDKILQRSLVTARIYNFYPDACTRSGSVDCPLKGEQMVRIDLGIAESVGASWHDKAIYLTNKTYQTQVYEGYTIRLISIDSQDQRAVISITKN